MTVQEFLGDDHVAQAVHRAVLRFLRTLGQVEEDATKTQVGWRRPGGPTFAWFWLPDRVLAGQPQGPVVSFTRKVQVRSPRIKQATRTGARWTHHLLVPTKHLDDAAKRLLAEAFKESGGQGQGGRPRPSTSRARPS
jgi:hypothetical protein